MLKNLMRMEERIVLDGAVAAAAAGGDAASNTSEAAGATDGIAPLSPENDNDISTDNENKDSDGQSNIAVAGMDAEGNPDAIEAEHAVAAMESALDNINNAGENSTPLKALIVNTDITDSADLIAAAADDIIVITYDNDTADMQSVLDQLNAIVGEGEYESIALATHSGAGGEILLTDNEHISAQSLSSDSEQIAFFSGIGDMLTENGRIDLLSCYSGLGEAGDNLIESIENISGAEVAASTDATGNETANGDWILEKGNIEVSSIYFDDIDLEEYTSTMSTELQKILGSTTAVGGLEDRELGQNMVYADNGTTDINDDTLAVLGEQNSNYYIYLYENSASGFTLETTIELGNTWRGDVDIAISSYSNAADSQVLAASIGNIVYLFEEGAGTTGWEDTTDTSDAVASSLTDPNNLNSSIFTSNDLSIDIIAGVLAVGDYKAKNTVSSTDYADTGKVYIFDRAEGCCSTEWEIKDNQDLKSTLFPKFDIDKTPQFGKEIKLVDVNNDSAADQVFITSGNGYTSTANAVGDGLYMVSMSETTAATIEVDTTYREFSTEAGKTIDNFEVVSYYNSGTYKEDIFVSYHTGSTYEVKHSLNNSLDDGGNVFSFCSTPSYSNMDTNTNNTDPVTLAAYANTDGSVRQIAIGAEPSGSSTSREVDIFSYVTSSYIKTGDNIIAADPGSYGHDQQNFGAAMIFLDGTNLLISAPTTGDYNVSSPAEKQGLFLTTYNSTNWGYTDPVNGFQINQATKLIAPAALYPTDFGKEIVVDGGLAVMSTETEMLVYTYSNATSQWSYLTTLQFSNLGSDLDIYSARIYDMALDNQNLVVSVFDSNDCEVVYFFEGVAPGRANAYETGKLTFSGYNSTNDRFGSSIDIEGNAIFISNINDNGTASNLNDDTTSIYTYYYNGTNWGEEESGSTRKESRPAIVVNAAGSGDIAEDVHLDADQIKNSNTYNLAVSIYNVGEGAEVGKVFIYEGVDPTTSDTYTPKELTFSATSYGGDASSKGFGTSIAINDDVVVVGMGYYKTASSDDNDMGALLVYKADDSSGWTAGEASLTGVFTLNTGYDLSNAALGGSEVTLGDNGEMFATGGNQTIGYHAFGWDITDQLATATVEVVTPTVSGSDGYDTYQSSDGNTTRISSLAYSETTKKLLTGSDSANKDATPAISEEGVVNIFNVTNYTSPYMTQPSTSYTPGSDAGDMGDYIVTFSEPTTIITASGKLVMEFYNMTTSHSTTVEFTSSEAAQLFNTNNTQLTFDLNNAKFNFVTDNSHYSIFIPKDTFKDSSGCVNPDISYTLTVIEGEIVVTPSTPHTTVTDPTSDQGRDSTSDLTRDPSLGDLLDMLGEGLGDGLDRLLGLGDSRFTDLMSAADALGMGFGSGIALGINDAINMGLGMNDALAMVDAIGMGEGFAGDIQDRTGAAQDATGENGSPAKDAAIEAAKEAAEAAAAEGATPAEIAEAAAEAAKEALPPEGEPKGEKPDGEAGEEVVEGEEAAEEGEETAEGEEAAEGDQTAEGDNQGEATAEAEANNQGENEGESDTDSPTAMATVSTRESQNMIVDNPYSESISAQQTDALFSSSIQAFSSLALGDGGLVFGMAQDAMGDTMTTAALVSSSEQILDAAREFLALIDAEEIDRYSLSGSGYTAATESVSMIIEDAIAAMVEARGNALVANDLLRILSINIKGFDDRIAGNSFSAGVQRLASCNQELAYTYEVLNSVLKAVQTAKDSGTPLTVAKLNELLPQIEEHAKEVSLSVSEKGDRASKDVLTFLTKRMQQKGIDKDNLQAQINDIFKEWHSNLGLSAPVTADQISIDLAQAM